MRRSVPNLAVLALLGAFVAAPGAMSRAQLLPAVDAETQERQAEALIAQAINAERIRLASNAKPLSLDPVLGKIAYERSNDMAHDAPFGHEDAAGRLVADDMVRARMGPYGAVGENIIYEWDPSHAFTAESFAQHAVQAWMNSEGHRANILSPQFDRTGVGVVISGSLIYATQIFWGRATDGRGKAVTHDRALSF